MPDLPACQGPTAPSRSCTPPRHWSDTNRRPSHHKWAVRVLGYPRPAASSARPEHGVLGRELDRDVEELLVANCLAQGEEDRVGGRDIGSLTLGHAAEELVDVESLASAVGEEPGPELRR